MKYPTFYRTAQIDGLSIFYREAGPKDAPTILLLHGLPSSSRMFEPLFARLSDRYHLVAPDYPGFGHSDWPDPKKFAYTFDHYAEIMNHFTEALGLSRYTLYMQDYGGPVGFRMVLAHPERVRSPHCSGRGRAQRRSGRELEDTSRLLGGSRCRTKARCARICCRWRRPAARHVGNDPNLERHDPDLWTDEFYFLSQPGQAEIQSDLFYDYRTNVDAYPKWQAWMREKQPRLLVIWGKYELSFDPGEPEPIAEMCPMPKFTSLTAVILRWTRPQMRSPHSCKDSSGLQAKARRRAGRDEEALRGPVTQLCSGFFKSKGFACWARKQPS